MKNPCKELEHTVWIKDGNHYELYLNINFWKLQPFSGQNTTESILTPFTKHCPKPERITNWLEKNGYKRK
jgi:hypothetical protein